MKKLICITLCILLATSLVGCNEEELQSPGTFYYYRAETEFSGTDGVLAPEEHELHGIEHDLAAILALYCEGPDSRELENPLPSGCSVPGFTLEGGILTLQFSQELAALTGVELTVAAGCLARTFLPLTGAEKLVLTADGALLDGETAMTLRLSDLGLQDDSLDLLHGTYTVYYTGADRRYLVGQSLSVNLSSREELPMLLLEQMRTPPTGMGLRSVLPEGCRILGVSVKDGLCTVDLSTEFETRHFYSHTGQILSLMGIVNTLCALEEIEQVEFTVDGSLLVHYGSLTIPGPLVPDERVVGPVRTALGERDGTLYLTEEGDDALIPMPTRLRQSGAFSGAEMIVRALLADPGTNGLGTCIPEGTALNSIRVERQICRVDLSKEYLSEPEKLRAAGRVITASLCELDNVSAVCITVDGAVPAEFDSRLFGVLVPSDDWFL